MHFEVQKKRGPRANIGSYVTPPSIYPCCVLVFNYDWNDFDWYTWFCLYYYDDSNQQHKIGELKILTIEGSNTFELIPKRFDEALDDSFCSLGIAADYYLNLMGVISNEDVRIEILTYLKDVTIDSKRSEYFRQFGGFYNSLMREFSSQQALEQAPLILANRNIETFYSFGYKYVPLYNKDSYSEWDVKFDYRPEQSYKRCVGIIGENGVGKTQMMSQWLKDVVNKDVEGYETGFIGDTPMFRSCIAVCSNSYDGYSKIKGNDKVDYEYISLEQNSDEFDAKMKSFATEIISRPLVKRRSMRTILSEIIEVNFGININKAFISKDTGEDDDEHEEIDFDEQVFCDIIHKMSSGERQILALLMCICAKVHFSTIFIFDEPEIHLHPKYIMCFVSVLYTLLSKFDSYAIIATHSPLIIREIPNSRVYLMERKEEVIPFITKVKFPTFGEDVTSLYREIFGYDEQKSYYTELIRRFKRNGKNYDDITNIIKQDCELSMNARLIIRDILSEQ